MKHFRTALALALAAFPAAAAADDVTINISGIFDRGSYAGSSYSGFFSYDTNAPLMYEYDAGGSAYQAVYEGFTGELTIDGGFYSITGDRFTVSDSYSSEPDYIHFETIGRSPSAEFSIGFDPDTFSGTAPPSAETLNGSDASSVGLMVGTNEGDGRDFSGIAYSAETIPAVPEPATWAMMILGFGFVGAALRRQQARVSGSLATA